MPHDTPLFWTGQALPHRPQLPPLSDNRATPEPGPTAQCQGPLDPGSSVSCADGAVTLD